MKDVEVHALAARQSNRLSREQLEDLGLSPKAIQHRLRVGRLVRIVEGVFALPPVLDDDRAKWMTAALAAPESYLNRLSAACSWGVLNRRPAFETVVRPGSGGPRRFEGIVVYRSTTLDGETTGRDGIPITTMPRTLLDLACFVSEKALARAVRESIRLKRTTTWELGDYLGRCQGRKGCLRLAQALARYKGLPLDRARSGAEIRALELLRGAGRPMPRLNFRIAGEEADLSWPQDRLVIEIDGGPFHQDVGEDARKEERWRSAGWRVERIPSDDVYDYPGNLLDLAPSNVRE